MDNAQPAQAHVEISIGPSSVETSVRLNGVDVTKYLECVTVTSRAGWLPQVTLELHRGNQVARAEVARALADVQVTLVDAPPPDREVELVEAPPPEEQDATTTDPSTTT